MKKTISIFIASFLSIPTVILICVACAFLSAFIYIQKVETFNTNVTNLYSYIESTYQNQLTRIQNVAESDVVINYVSDPANQDYRNEAVRTLFNTFNLEDNILEVSLVAPDGSILISSTTDNLEPNQSETILFQRVMETKKPYTTMRFTNDVPLLKIGYPIFVNNELKAIYIRYTPLLYLNIFADNINENEESVYLITDDSNGVVYNSTDPDSIYSITNTETENIPSEIAELENILNSPNRVDEGTINISINNQSVVGYYRIIPDLNWICMICQPRALILYDLNLFQLITLLTSALYIIFANISVRKFFGKYVNTIEDFNDTALNFEEGEHNIRFEAPDGMGNLSDLASNMNHILNHVEQVETHNRRITDELDTILSTDPITKLLNNRALYSEIDGKFGKSSNQLLVMFNTGIFKQLNETFGNSVANRLLEIIADSIREFEGENFHTARLAQDSFCIFIDNFDDINKIHHKLNELRLRLEAINHIDDLEIQMHPNITAVFRDERLLGRSDWLRLATEVLEESSLPNGSFTIFDFTNVSEINHPNPEYISNILFKDNVALEGFSRSGQTKTVQDSDIEDEITE